MDTWTPGSGTRENGGPEMRSGWVVVGRLPLVRTGLGLFQSDTLRRLLHHKLSVVGMVCISVIVFMAIFADVISPADPLEFNPYDTLAKPSLSHPLGTDHFGRDQLSRLFHGARISLIVGVLSVLLAVALGVPTGIAAAFWGGWVDHLLMRLVDVRMAIPNLLLAILLLLVLGGGVITVSIALGLNLWATQARLVRSQALSVKEREYFTAAKAIGSPAWRLMFLHMLPNSIQPVIVQASLGVGFAVLGEAGLSFIGVGVMPPTPTWGSMLNTAFQYLNSAPWLSFAPGLAIFIMVLAFNFVGDGLRDVLDPRLRGRI